MKDVYKITTVYGTVLVVAGSFGEAAEIYQSHYWPTSIRDIHIFDEEVLLQMKPKEA